MQLLSTVAYLVSIQGAGWEVLEASCHLVKASRLVDVANQTVGEEDTDTSSVTQSVDVDQLHHHMHSSN